MTERIRKTEEFLRAKLAESPYFIKKPESGAYRLEHSIRVAQIAGAIAKAEGMDEESMIIAGLLHDVSYCLEIDENGWKNHGRDAARIARPFLEELGFGDETVNEICFGIAIHVDDEADFEGERTAFALTVGDADNIDRFDAYRLYETLENAGYSKLSAAEKQAHVNKTLERLEKYLELPFATESASALWRERLNFYRDFYIRLREQLAMSAGYCDSDRKPEADAPAMNENLLGLAGHF